MKIACLSGKGGAGKTFVATNLAAAAGACTYIDCDVEEPNGHLFWKPENITSAAVTIPLPNFDAQKCIGCRKCVDFCNFHALAFLKEKPMVFPTVCHSCGGCKLVCPTHAVTLTQKPIGTVETGYQGAVTVVTGTLNVGESTGVPVIRQALKQASALTIIDCPPGSACPVMESVMEADFCVLVAEPTSFGFHNFKMVHQLITLLGKKCGVIINKQSDAYPPLETFCQANQLLILARIPYLPALAQQIANGVIVAQSDANEAARFASILKEIRGLA